MKILFDKKLVQISIPIFLLVVTTITVIFLQTSQEIRQRAAGAFPHVVGNQIIDGNGNPILLRGVQIPSEFNLGWKGGGNITQALGPNVLTAIHSWGANVLRLPVGAYEYQQAGYMAALDTVVQNANNQGLYIIFANFEDAQAMGGNSVLDQQGLAFWTFMAQHYKTNPMVMFDLLNEPKNSSYAEWLNGAGGVVGMQQIVNAIRAQGAQQIVVAEWIDQGTAGFAGFTSFINDPNIMYSMHMYFKAPNLRTTAGWDSNFGNIAGTHPVLIGEWALLPNARYPAFCQGLDAASGTQMVNNFLTYMEQHRVHWTAWAFNQSHLVKDTTSFTPTSLNDPWCCGLGPVCNAGMGTLIKQYLLTHGGPPPTAALSPTPTPGKNTVIINNMQFTPHGLAVPIGTTVTWTNQDTIAHTTTADNTAGNEFWNSGTLQPGQSFSKTFTIPGQYSYHCNIHPSMTGFIEVFGSISQTPTTTPIPSTPTPTNTPIPLATPTPTPTLTPVPTISGSTQLEITICPHGVYNCGDNADPSGGGNQSPQHTQRTVMVIVDDTNDNLVASAIGTVPYDAAQGNFSGNVAVSSLASGNYIIRIGTPGYLIKRVSAVVTITAQQVNHIPSVSLTAGDIDEDNQLDISDYNGLISCYGQKADTPSCSNKTLADLNDDGVIDGGDYNLFIRELSVQSGD